MDLVIFPPTANAEKIRSDHAYLDLQTTHDTETEFMLEVSNDQ